MRFVFPIVAFAALAFAEHGDPLSDKDHQKGGEHDSKYDHDAFLGKDTAAEFESLSKQTSQERLAALVDEKVDADKDGFVTEEELKAHIMFMQKRYVENDANRTWANFEQKLTADKLAWKDYREVTYGSEDDSADISPEYKKMIERDERRWKQADEDKDGQLTHAEYLCFMHPEDCDRMRDIVVRETLDDIDKNKDGFVDLEEYIGDMYRPDDYPELNGKEPDWVQSEREMFKEHRDKDGDGKLNLEEMTDWIMPVGFDHAEAEAKHLISIADNDKDGKLTTEEIVEHYDTFVGSQATDYGEELQAGGREEL